MWRDVWGHITMYGYNPCSYDHIWVLSSGHQNSRMATLESTYPNPSHKARAVSNSFEVGLGRVMVRVVVTGILPIRVRVMARVSTKLKLVQTP